MTLDALRCPRCGGGLVRPDAAALRCAACAAVFALDDDVACLVRDPATPALAARIAALDADMRRHDWVVAKMSLATLTRIPAARTRLLDEIGVAPGATVLDHCTGPGSNLPALSRAIGPRGRLVGMDLSGFVLRQARERARRDGFAVDLHQAEVTALPYADETFDAVVHYGALNQFGDETRPALDEILRVAKPGAVIVLLDEGLAEPRRRGWWGRLLTWGNPLFACRPPLHLLPGGLEPRVRWVIRGMFYEIRLRKPPTRA